MTRFDLHFEALCDARPVKPRRSRLLILCLPVLAAIVFTAAWF